MKLKKLYLLFFLLSLLIFMLFNSIIPPHIIILSLSHFHSIKVFTPKPNALVKKKKKRRKK